MSEDPFKASIQCAAMVAAVISVIYYLMNGYLGDYRPEHVVEAMFAGVTITGHLVVLAVALWVLSHFFK
jgi:hypothetical protein